MPPSLSEVITRSWYTAVDGYRYSWYSEEGTGSRNPPRTLLAVPNVAAHPSKTLTKMVKKYCRDDIIVSLPGFNIAGQPPTSPPPTVPTPMVTGWEHKRVCKFINSNRLLSVFSVYTILYRHSILVTRMAVLDAVTKNCLMGGSLLVGGLSLQFYD